MKRFLWLRMLAVMSALVLLGAACAGDDGDEGADPAPADAVSEPAEDQAAPEDDAAAAQDEVAAEPAAPGQVTAYVVGYHWGWALFDGDGNELDVLEVSVGTEVELVAVNDHASHAIAMLPGPVADAVGSVDWHDRAHHDVEMGRTHDPAVEHGGSLGEALDIAHNGHDHVGPTQDHGLMVTGIGVEAFLDAHADEPELLTFTVEHEGHHEFRCTVDCGLGHEGQRWEMLVVT